jgi:carbamoylphosphate synthase small subunit
MKDQGVPGIYGIDTRAVTMKLRDTGSLKGKIIVDVSAA